MNCKYKRESVFRPTLMCLGLAFATGVCGAEASMSYTTTAWLGFGLLAALAGVLSLACGAVALATYFDLPCGGIGREIDVFSQED